MIQAKIIEDSISDSNIRITTMQVQFHRFILPEFNTHRVFSRNFSSSRAIPTEKLINQVRIHPAIPVHWGKNQPGMQASEELDLDNIIKAHMDWKVAIDMAAGQAERLARNGAHKQIVNRVIEPYMWANGIVTSTEWENFFSLRDHPDAQPEICELAKQMKAALSNSTPKILQPGEWHLPYLSEEEKSTLLLDVAKKVSAARCCRVSYLKHDGTNPNVEEDTALFERLAGAVPLHASPLEHQATPDTISEVMQYRYYDNEELHGNLKGWIQFRKEWEQNFYPAPNLQ